MRRRGEGRACVRWRVGEAVQVHSGEECGPRERAEEEGPGSRRSLGGDMEEEGRRQPAQVLSLHTCFPVPAMESREDKEDWKSAEDGKREDKNDATLLLGGERNTNT